MFDGLHIKILLLEIHGQFIAGSRLAQFLDQAKVSITKTGKVSQITSARYLLQACLCTEYKAMRVLFDSSESTDHIQDWMEKNIRISHVQILENDI